MRNPKRRVTFNGRTYTVRKDKIDLPDLDAMSRFEALQWLSRETYPTGAGTRTKPNPLAGMGSILTVEAR